MRTGWMTLWRHRVGPRLVDDDELEV